MSFQTFSCADTLSRDAFLAGPGSSPGLGCAQLLAHPTEVDGGAEGGEQRLNPPHLSLSEAHNGAFPPQKGESWSLFAGVPTQPRGRTSRWQSLRGTSWHIPWQQPEEPLLFGSALKSLPARCVSSSKMIPTSHLQGWHSPSSPVQLCFQHIWLPKPSVSVAVLPVALLAPAAPHRCAINACVQCCAHRLCPSFAEPVWVRECPPRWSPVVSWTQSAPCHSCCFSFRVPCPLALSLCLTLGLKSLVDIRQHPASPSPGLCSASALFLSHPRAIRAAPCSNPCPQCAGPGSLLAARGSHSCSPHSCLLPPPLCRFAVGPYSSGSAPSEGLSPPLGATDPPPRVLPPSQPLPSAVSAAPPRPCLVLGTSTQPLPTNHNLGTRCSLAASQDLGVPMRPVVAVHRGEHSHTVEGLKGGNPLMVQIHSWESQKSSVGADGALCCCTAAAPPLLHCLYRGCQLLELLHVPLRNPTVTL